MLHGDEGMKIAMFKAQVTFGALALFALILAAVTWQSTSALLFGILGCGSVVLCQFFALLGSPRVAFGLWLGAFIAAGASAYVLTTLF